MHKIAALVAVIEEPSLGTTPVRNQPRDNEAIEEHEDRQHRRGHQLGQLRIGGERSNAREQAVVHEEDEQRPAEDRLEKLALRRRSPYIPELEEIHGSWKNTRTICLKLPESSWRDRLVANYMDNSNRALWCLNVPQTLPPSKECQEQIMC